RVLSGALAVAVGGVNVNADSILAETQKSPEAKKRLAKVAKRPTSEWIVRTVAPKAGSSE
ncbi:MAG TPA: hypothetical protein VNC50_09010, partial [Planctomycetia bacterium]|nr:hypothetical protein [Planctomycetia bacterium]